jgi:hypothetical protein
MKSIFLFTAVLLGLLSCHKDNNGECVSAVITKVIFNKCGADTVWGVELGQITYPTNSGFSDSVPAQFQQEGLQVCIQYKIYSIPYAGPCEYDGPYIQILSIKKAE